MGNIAIKSGIRNVSEDTTPQLGGDLDVNSNSIVSASNGDINITPNGTGNVSIGNFTFDGDQSVGAGQDNYVLTYDNATGLVSLEAAAGGGNVSNTGTPADSQIAVWTSATVIEGDSALTFDTSTDHLSTGTGGKITTGTIELGAASDTTLSRSAAGVLAVEGKNLEKVERYVDFSIPAGAWKPDSGNTSTTLSIEHGTLEKDCLGFDAAGGDKYYCTFRLPKDYAGGVLYWAVDWDAAATASGTASFGLKGGAYTDSDALSTALGTQRTVTDTLLTVGDVHQITDATGVTLAGTPAAGEFVTLELEGLAAGTIAVETYVLNIQVQYLTSGTTPTVFS